MYRIGIVGDEQEKDPSFMYIEKAREAAAKRSKIGPVGIWDKNDNLVEIVYLCETFVRA